MRVLGIDYGERRMGLALSDPLRIVAGGLPTVTVGSDDEAFAAVAGRRAEAHRRRSWDCPGT